MKFLVDKALARKRQRAAEAVIDVYGTITHMDDVGGVSTRQIIQITGMSTSRVHRALVVLRKNDDIFFDVQSGKWIVWKGPEVA